MQVNYTAAKASILLFLVFPNISGGDASLSQAELAIKDLQPSISYKRSRYLSNTFIAVSNEASCQIPWQILVSISFNESSLGLNLVNSKSKDYGLMQINHKNILRYGLSKDMLLQDAAYSIRFACKILADNKKRYSKKYPYWLGIYRSGTALWKQSIRENAKRYDKIIRRTAKRIGYNDESDSIRQTSPTNIKAD